MMRETALASVLELLPLWYHKVDSVDLRSGPINMVFDLYYTER